MTRTFCGPARRLWHCCAGSQNVSPADLDALKRLLSAGAQKQARDAAEQLIERAEKHPPSLLELGQFAGVAKEFSLAERHSRGPWMRPGSFEAQFNLGLTRFQMQNVHGPPWSHSKGPPRCGRIPLTPIT